MKKIFLLIILFIFTNISSVISQVPQQIGLWKFDDNTDLTKAEIGTSLELVGLQEAIVGSTTGDGAVKIGLGSYYKIKHGISPNGGGASVNEYSLQFDFKVNSLAKWYTFFQTSSTNSDDGSYSLTRLETLEHKQQVMQIFKFLPMSGIV